MFIARGSFGGRDVDARAARGRGTLLVLAAALALAACHRDDRVESRASAVVTPPTVGQFVVYGERSVTFARDTHVNGGDVGVRMRGTSGFGPQLKLATSALVDTQRSVYAPSVSLDSLATVGKVFADSVVNNGGTRGALAPFPAADMPAGPLASAGKPGTTNVSVASGTNRTLDPGNYGTLTIAGTGAVYLKPGSFSFASITLADRATLVAKGGGTSNVYVEGQLVAGARVTLSVVTDGAGALRLSVAGNDGTKKAATIGSYSSVVALITVPHGTLSIGDHTDAKGAFAAFDVATADAVVLTYQKGFSPPSGTPPQQLTGYLTPAIAGAPIVGPVPQDTQVDLSIGLALADRAGLVQKFNDVSDPASASYRQYLTPTQITSAYMPSAANYSALTSWATAAGLTVTESTSNRLLLHVRGTAARVSQALSSNLVNRARADGSSFRSLDREPAVTLAASNPITRISGLDTFAVPEPLAGSGPRGTFVSKDFHESWACGANTGTGAGQKIGLLEFDGYRTADITGYGCQAGLVTCDAAGNITAGTLPPVTSVFIDGYDGSIIKPNGRGEVTTDIQVAMAMAPGLAGITLFQAASGGGVARVNHLFDKMAADPSIKQLSSSWRVGTDANTQHLLYVLAVQGQSFVEAVGDRGSASWSGDPGDVRSMEGVTVVGGTRLFLDNFQEYEGEETFNEDGQGAAGGGIAASTPIPLYQAPFGTALGVSHRMLPDVAMGVSAGFFSDGVFGGTFGTSISAPLFAGWLALANEKSASLGIASAGFVNKFLYTVGGAATPIYQASFHDIADGSHNAGTCATAGNGTCAAWTKSTTSTDYSAIAGYDMATGLGTPKCHLLDELGTSTIEAPAVDAGTPPSDGGADAGASGPSVAVVATVGSDGLMFCMQGGGFPEGSSVQFTYLNLPGNLTSPQREVSAPVIVGLGGRYTNFDPTFGGGASSLFGFNTIHCTPDDLTKSMTVQAVQVEDPMRVATATISNSWICHQEPRQTGMNLTPLPFPMNNITHCPLPPE